MAVGGAALLSVESSSPLEMLPCVHFEGRRGEQPDAFRANLIAQAGAESADVAVDGAVAKRSRLAPIINFARMVEEYWLGIIRWFASRITNGLLEGLNSLVQAAKRRARGYRSTRNYIAMIYLTVGKLDLHVTHAK